MTQNIVVSLFEKQLIQKRGCRINDMLPPSRTLKYKNLLGGI